MKIPEVYRKTQEIFVIWTCYVKRLKHVESWTVSWYHGLVVDGTRTNTEKMTE